MPVIDIHTHFIPEFVLADGVFDVTVADGWVAHAQGFRYPAHPEFVDVGAKLAGMDAAGIDVAVLSLSPTLFFYEVEPDEAVAFARRANDALAELVDGRERLHALAHLPLQAPDEAAAELTRCVEELGFRGAQIGTSAGGGRPIDDPAHDAVLAAAARLGVPLMLHPYYVGPKPGLEDYYFTNSLGNPTDTTVAAARLLHADVLDRFPSLSFVLVHAGGFLPFQIGRLDHAHRVREEPRRDVAQPPSSRLRRLWMDTIAHSDEALAFLVDRIGTDRVVVGTDAPFDMADPRPVERLRRVGVDPDALGATAARLLRIDA